MSNTFRGWSKPMVGQLPPSFVPCATCGIGVPDGPDRITYQPMTYTDRGGRRDGHAFVFGRCEPCAERAEAWGAWAVRNKGNVRGLTGGSDSEKLARVRAESLAAALHLLRYDGTVGLDSLIAAGLNGHPQESPAFDLRFEDYAIRRRLSYDSETRQYIGATTEFGHVSRDLFDSLSTWAADKRSLAAGKSPMIPVTAAASLIHAGPDDDAITTGCYCCGIDAAPSPRAGAHVSDVWRPYSQPATAFGKSVHLRRAAGRVVGVVCPGCAPHTDEHAVSGELAESLTGDLFGLSHWEVYEHGPMILFAGAVVRARRAGQAVPTAGEAWGHLLRDENGDLIRPATGAPYVPTAAEPKPAPTKAELEVAKLRRELAQVREVAKGAVDLLMEAENERAAVRAAATRPPAAPRKAPIKARVPTPRPQTDQPDPREVSKARKALEDYRRTHGDPSRI